MFKKVITLIFIATILSGCNNSTSSITSTSTSSSSSSSSISTSSTTSSTSSSSSSTSEDDWFKGRNKLSCGYYEMDLPKNSNNPVQLLTDTDSSHWYNNNTKEEIPNGFRYIYKNSCDDGPKYHKCSANFYSSSGAGGIKFSNVGIGIQSSMFSHTGEKLEIRLGISQVNNASDTPEEKKDTGYIYFFDKSGKLLGDKVIERGSITSQSAGNYLKIYNTEDYIKDVAYFDFRLNAKPFKSSQCYNFGIEYINIKSWLYA